MELNKKVLEIMEAQLAEGIIEKAISEKLSEGVNKAVDGMFGNWGDATKLIEEKIKSVLIPQLESYDYSQHIIKLDSVLTEIMQATTVDNKKVLNNFKNFMIQPEEKEIKVSDLFNQYAQFLGNEADTDDLIVNTDDGAPYYEGFDASYEVEYNEDRDWSSFKHATLVFENDHQDELNFEIRLSKFGDREGWDIYYSRITDLRSLRRMNNFEILLMNLDQCGVKLIIDEDHDGTEVEITREPECTYEFR